MAAKIPVGILGATGIVGQRFVQMLEHHPWFEVAWLAASDRSEGRPYAEAARWKLKTPIPTHVARMKVATATAEGAPRLIFAALDASIAAELEPRFAEAGCAVVTNSSALRMQRDVPLVIPEVNHEHIKLLECQAWRKKSGGFVVTNPNCSAIGLVLALAPLEQQFGLDSVMVVTMQAVSGAGYPGVASLDILGNVIPYIAKEEEKMEEETRKLLGRLNGSGIEMGTFGMSAQCNRVAVDGVRDQPPQLRPIDQFLVAEAERVQLGDAHAAGIEFGVVLGDQHLAAGQIADQPRSRDDRRRRWRSRMRGKAKDQRGKRNDSQRDSQHDQPGKARIISRRARPARSRRPRHRRCRSRSGRGDSPRRTRDR